MHSGSRESSARDSQIMSELRMSCGKWNDKSEMLMQTEATIHYVLFGCGCEM